MRAFNSVALFIGRVMLLGVQRPTAASFIREPVPKEIAEPGRHARWTVPVVVIRYM